MISDSGGSDHDDERERLCGTEQTHHTHHYHNYITYTTAVGRVRECLTFGNNPSPAKLASNPATVQTRAVHSRRAAGLQR